MNASGPGRQGEKGGCWAGGPRRWVEQLGLPGEVGWSEGVGPAEPDPRRRFKGKNRFLNFKDFLNLARLGKILQGDLGGILIWGFFLNSSRLLKDFRKKYNMPCHAMHPIQDLFLESFFICTII
jgi:hypothetical protein